MVLQSSFINGFFPRLDWSMNTTAAPVAEAIEDQPKETKNEDMVGPLPNIKLFIPKGGFQPPKHGLPINPSPHNRTASDPAIQAPFSIPDPAIQAPFPRTKSVSTEKSTVQSPIEMTTQTPLERTTQTPLEKVAPSLVAQPTQIPVSRRYSVPPERSPIPAPEKLPKLSIDVARQETQESREIAIQTEDLDDLDCHYCRGCQKRLSLRSDTSTSTVSSVGSSPNIPASPKKASKFGRRFKFGVLQRGNTKFAKVETKKTKEVVPKEKEDGTEVTDKAAKRLTSSKKIDFETISPTDHWADE